MVWQSWYDCKITTKKQTRRLIFTFTKSILLTVDLVCFYYTEHVWCKLSIWQLCTYYSINPKSIFLNIIMGTFWWISDPNKLVNVWTTSYLKFYSNDIFLCYTKQSINDKKFKIKLYSTENDWQQRQNFCLKFYRNHGMNLEISRLAPFNFLIIARISFHLRST